MLVCRPVHTVARRTDASPARAAGVLPRRFAVVPPLSRLGPLLARWRLLVPLDRLRPRRRPAAGRTVADGLFAAASAVGLPVTVRCRWRVGVPVPSVVAVHRFVAPVAFLVSRRWLWVATARLGLGVPPSTARVVRSALVVVGPTAVVATAPPPVVGGTLTTAAGLVTVVASVRLALPVPAVGSTRLAVVVGTGVLAVPGRCAVPVRSRLVRPPVSTVAAVSVAPSSGAVGSVVGPTSSGAVVVRFPSVRAGGRRLTVVPVPSTALRVRRRLPGLVDATARADVSRRVETHAAVAAVALAAPVVSRPPVFYRPPVVSRPVAAPPPG